MAEESIGPMAQQVIEHHKDRADALGAALRWYIKHVEDCEGTDFLSDTHCGHRGVRHA